MTVKKAQCGTTAARRRHRRHNETCEACTPKGYKLQPCGTPAAWVRHRRRNEDPCDPCQAAYRAYDLANKRRKGVPPRKGGALENLIDEAEHLVSLGQGTDYILRALGYAGRERQLRDRLQKHGRVDVFHKVCSEEYWLAA